MLFAAQKHNSEKPTRLPALNLRVDFVEECGAALAPILPHNTLIER